MRFFVLFVMTMLMSFQAGAIGRGGSNYHWYAINGCDREPYGVLANYHLARDQIDNQLIQMYMNGQRRMRVAIYHSRDFASGTVINSQGGNLPAQQRENLAQLLATMKAIGYWEILVGFFPQGNNNPAHWSDTTNWSSWHESYFQENWNLIYNLMPIIRDAGIQYRVDLGNELIFPLGSPPNVKNMYSRKLWGNFTARFDRSESVGFSFPSGPDNDISQRISGMKYVYGTLPPYLFDFHLYDNTYPAFFNIHDKLTQAGFRNEGLILGELYYNNADQADALTWAISASGRTIHYVLQWPWDKQGPDCGGINVAPPVDFSNYINAGF